MTDTERYTPSPSPEAHDEQVEQLEHDAEAMKRYDRAIPLPPEDGEEDEGVGEITGIVP